MTRRRPILRSGWSLLLVVALAWSAPAAAQSRNLVGRFGLGLQLGDPSGVTGKLWLSPRTALQGTLGVFGDGFNSAAVTVDWVYELTSMRPAQGGVTFGLHLGAGGAMGFGGCYRAFGSRICDSDLSLAARVPFAGNLYIDGVPAEFYLELVPTFALSPAVYGGWAAGLGGRYYF